MASKCIDYSDQTVRNQLALSTGPTVNADGSFTVNQIDVWSKELAENILQEAENNPVQIAVNRYGSGFYDAVNYLNGEFRNRVRDGLDGFDDLARRWEKGDITSLEAADFMNVSNYTPDGIQSQRDYVKLTRNLDAYYKDSFAQSIMGGFCQSMENIFANIDQFYELIGVIDGYIKDAAALLEKIRNFDGISAVAVQAAITALINKIKDEIVKVVDEIIQEIEDAISNFDISNLIDEIQDGHTKSVKAIMTAKEQMCAAFTEENKKSVRDKAKGLIDYAVSLFESPNIEQIQFMVYRFCALATNIELLFKELKQPLDDYGFRYRRITQRLSAISNVNTSTAIRNGAIRFSPEKREETINSLRALWDGEGGERITPSGEEPITVKPIKAEEYQNLPHCGAVFSGKHEWLSVKGDSFDEKEGIGIRAYTRVDLDVKVYLARIREDIGGEYVITDGWVSKKWNDKQENDSDNTHLSGLVIDIERTADLDIDIFTEAAYKAGFKNVVAYEKHIHLDIRELPR